MIIIVVIDDQTWLRGRPCAGGEGRQSWMGVGKMRGRGERIPVRKKNEISPGKKKHLKNLTSLSFLDGGREERLW